jgi:hypothetical protein
MSYNIITFELSVALKAREIRPICKNIRTKGAQTRTQQKENNEERNENFVDKQMYFSVNNDNEVAWCNRTSLARIM